MHITELSEVLEHELSKVKFSVKTVSTANGSKYHLQDLSILSNSLDRIYNLNIEYFNTYIDEIRKILFATPDTEELILAPDVFEQFTTILKDLKNSVRALISYGYQGTLKSDDSLKIKLPHFEKFDELAKICNELKHAIELPIYDSDTGGTVEIKSAEPGSVVLFVYLGSMAAVALIGKICMAAIKIRKEYALSELTVQHAKTLKLNNDALESFIAAAKNQVENATKAEAEEIAAGYYNGADPEKIKRLELSINTVKTLVDRGTMIGPASSASNAKSLFPDPKELLDLYTQAKGIEEGE